MENVTDRTSNPFGMRAPCTGASGGERADGGIEGGTDGEAGDDRAVYGYGEANADFHVVGDYPGLHGGTTTGVPFTETEAGRRLQRVLHAVGFLEDPYSDRPTVDNCFLSYLCMCPTPDGAPPDDAEYDRLERYLDAELRAISAHVLIPVGRRAIEYVLNEHTSNPDRFGPVEDLHARELKGRGFLIVPVREPSEWTDDDERALVDRLEATLASDYAQISDLGRYLADDTHYFVR